MLVPLCDVIHKKAYSPSLSHYIVYTALSLSLLTSLYGCLDHFFSLLNFRHSSLITHYSLLITHHLKYPAHLALSLINHYSSLNIFHSRPLILLLSPFFGTRRKNFSFSLYSIYYTISLPLDIIQKQSFQFEIISF